MRISIVILTLLHLNVFAQEKAVVPQTVDSLYREDQFYIGMFFNSLQNKPNGLKQNKISSGFSLGFIRDMPINKSRTFAIGAGLGYSFNILNDNLYTYNTTDDKNNTTNVYEILSPDIYYTKNNLSLNYIEVPIEIRWRNSTFESHKFWRIYAGFKLSYLIADKYKFINDIQNTTIKRDTNLNKMQYGCYLASGWNTLNIYIYYGLNPIFKSSDVNGQPNKMNSFNLGFQFYIL